MCMYIHNYAYINYVKIETQKINIFSYLAHINTATNKNIQEKDEIILSFFNFLFLFKVPVIYFVSWQK